MSKTTPRERSSDRTELTQPVIEAFEAHLERNPLPIVPRKAIVGDLIHAGKSLEDANRAITAAHRSQNIVQFRADAELYLAPDTETDETLLAALESHLETGDGVDDRLVGALNARRQQLREDDTDE